MRQAAKWLLGLAGFALLALAAWESFAVWRAWQRTPAVLARAARGELELPDAGPRRLAWIVKVDDPNFFGHNGFDWGTPGQGNTNLTQSLVKRFYFSRFQPGFAKIEQALIARFVLDRALSKQGQLKAYLNHAYLGQDRGRSIVGYAAAARSYYGKPFAALSDDEFLSLLAMTVAPRDLNPRSNPQENKARVARIKRYLAGQCAPADRSDVRYVRCA
jgi:membrane carboxypeptidase/penicillin-binding protein